MRKSSIIILLQRADEDETSGNQWWILDRKRFEEWLKDGSIGEPDIIIIPKRAYLAKEVKRVKIEKFDIEKLLEG